MAKKALINKQQKTPKFKVRAYTRCKRCGRPHSVYRKFGLCRICLREMVHAGDLPGMDHLAQADPAEAELAVHGVRTAALLAPGVGTDSELRLPRRLLDQGSLRHVSSP